MDVKQYRKAETEFRKAVELNSKHRKWPKVVPLELHRPSKFMTGLAISKLGDAILAQKRYKEADSTFKRAEQIVADDLGKGHYWVAEILSHCLYSQQLQEKLKAARAEVVRGGRTLLGLTESAFNRDAEIFNRYAKWLEQCGERKLAQELRARVSIGRAKNWTAPV